jgi:hypothetical protein
MKLFLSIFLLLITALYVLPVKEILTAGHDICFADLDKCKEECKTKENAKELFVCDTIYPVINDSYSFNHYSKHLDIPVLIHTVETPPPNLA